MNHVNAVWMMSPKGQVRIMFGHTDGHTRVYATRLSDLPYRLVCEVVWRRILDGAWVMLPRGHGWQAVSR